MAEEMAHEQASRCFLGCSRLSGRTVSLPGAGRWRVAAAGGLVKGHGEVAGQSALSFAVLLRRLRIDAQLTQEELGGRRARRRGNRVALGSAHRLATQRRLRGRRRNRRAAQRRPDATGRPPSPLREWRSPPGRLPVRRPASTIRHSAVNVVLRHVRCPTLQKWPNGRRRLTGTEAFELDGDRCS